MFTKINMICKLWSILEFVGKYCNQDIVKNRQVKTSLKSLLERDRKESQKYTVEYH